MNNEDRSKHELNISK